MLPICAAAEYFLKGENRPGRKTCWFFDPPYQRQSLYKGVFVKIMDRMEGEDELWVQTGMGSLFQTECEAVKSFVQGGNRFGLLLQRGG